MNEDDKAAHASVENGQDPTRAADRPKPRLPPPGRAGMDARIAVATAIMKEEVARIIPDRKVRAALERAAKADDLPVSSLVQRILRAWLVENGHLNPKGE